ncbi:MotA/TolQ/ExbB proton channel family protein [Pseudoroseomonas globiformis]|uniref:MotA/TolQ/ExbB proton channel family protein n=1 Tax=Teichococcus globiformis TaxID=2307229 RepID=A0ABV7FZI1_9PROT
MLEGLPEIAGAGLHGPDMSMLGLFMQADWVVKAVMIGLALASVICWAIIIEKSLLLGRISREVKLLVAASLPGTAPTPPQGEGLSAQVLRAGTREWHDGREEAESRFEFRHRIEHAMRHALGRELRKVEPGLPFLATTGAVAPFIGLFGTVWGIMNSFAGIAQSNDTSLAVVAPGIAEALFATAIGLIAAIPAVMAYNRLLVRTGRLRQEALSASVDVASNLSRRQAHMVRTHASAAAE